MQMRRGGMTLVEVLIAAFLFLLVSIGLLLLLERSMRVERVTTHLAGLQCDATAARARLVADLTEASMDGTLHAFDPNGRWVALATARNLAGAVQFRANGRPQWMAWIVYYIHGSGRLHRRRVEVTPAAGFDPLPWMDGRGACIATDVTRLDVTLSTSGRPHFELRVHAEKPFSSRLDRIVVEGAIFPASDNGP